MPFTSSSFEGSTRPYWRHLGRMLLPSSVFKTPCQPQGEESRARPADVLITASTTSLSVAIFVRLSEKGEALIPVRFQRILYSDNFVAALIDSMQHALRWSRSARLTSKGTCQRVVLNRHTLPSRQDLPTDERRVVPG